MDLLWSVGLNFSIVVHGKQRNLLDVFNCFNLRNTYMPMIVEFLETAPKCRRRKKNSSLCVYVLHKTSHQEISRPSRAVN